MKEDNRNDTDEIFASWIKADIRLVDDQLEDKIMANVIQDESSTIIHRKVTRRLRNRLIVGYCISTFIVILACLWDTPFFIHFDLPPSRWSNVMNVPVINYTVMIITTVSLSLFFFILHWWQSKKAMHHPG